MNKLCCSVLLLVSLLIGVAYAQDATLSLNGLPELRGLTINESIAGAEWTLAYHWRSEEYVPEEPDMVANGLRAGVMGNASGKEREFLRAFARQAADAIDGLGRFGGYRAGFMHETAPPVRFFAQDGELGVLVSSLGLSVNFNTLQTNESERIEQVLFEMVIPELAQPYRAFEGTDVGLLGIAVSYGASDFTDDNDLPRGETLIAIFPMGALAEHNQFAISDSQLVSRGIILAGGASGVRRVNVTR